MARLSAEQVQLLAQVPVGHLSTASKAGAPHVIPVCFTLNPHAEESPIYIALDQKPKRAALTRLRRVRNILENPQVSLVVDHYDSDWTQLWYILLTGTAELLEGDAPYHPVATEDNPIPVDPGPIEWPGSADPAHPELVEGRSNYGERLHAIHLLRQKYPQYRTMDIDDNPVIKITPQRIVSWSSSPQSPQ